MPSDSSTSVRERFVCWLIGHDWYPMALPERENLYDMECYRCGEQETFDEGWRSVDTDSDAPEVADT